MSRAFVKEDAGWGDPGKRYSLPARDDPGYDEAAAEALLEAARAGDTGSAESATGYYGEKSSSARLSSRFSRAPSVKATSVWRSWRRDFSARSGPRQTLGALADWLARLYIVAVFQPAVGEFHS
jgi:hypothetical protein